MRTALGLVRSVITKRVVCEVMSEVSNHGVQVVAAVDRVHRLDEEGPRMHPEVMRNTAHETAGPGEIHGCRAVSVELGAILSGSGRGQACEVGIQQPGQCRLLRFIEPICILSIPAIASDVGIGRTTIPQV